ncbi:MAG: hypothetical protein QXQ57_06180 [Sulfolobales archaeon]
MLSDRWVIGLGIGHQLFEEFAGIGSEVTGTCRGLRTFNISIDGHKVTLIASAAGGLYTEEILGVAYHRGVKYIVGLGACGALREDLDLCDVIIPIASVRGENLTDYYVEKSYPAVADFDMLSILKSELEASGLKPRIGIVYTTPSVLTEDPMKMKILGDMGISCIECEVSVLYTISRLIGIRSAALLIVSDHVVKEKQLDEATQKNYRDLQKRILSIVVNMLSRLNI